MKKDQYLEANLVSELGFDLGLPEGEELGTLNGEELDKPLGIPEGEELGSLLCEELGFTEGPLLWPALERLLGDALGAELGLH